MIDFLSKINELETQIVNFFLACDVISPNYYYINCIFIFKKE